MSDWGALGDHVFKIRQGPNSENLKMGVDYAQHARIGRKPTQQATAQRLQEMELSVLFHATNGPVSATIEALRKSMDEYEILDLIHGEQPGTGFFAGQWVITDMQVENFERVPGGAVYSAEVKIQLKEWAKREGLEVSKRRPPPAVKPKPKAEIKGEGYK